VVKHLNMRWFIVAALLLLATGAGCLFYAYSFPVYTEADAPRRVAAEVEKSFPLDRSFDGSHAKDYNKRSKEWFTRLRSFETPHKRFSDLGRALCAGGAGLLASLRLWALYHRSRHFRKTAYILIIWIGLWLVRIPLSFWYYLVRQQRSDYPWWSDSIAIPIFFESGTWVVGAGVSSIILWLLLKGQPLPAAIRLVRPASASSWRRTVFIGAWLLFLGWTAISGIIDGDEGSAFVPPIAAVILLAILSATTLSPSNPPCSSPPATTTGGN